MKAAAPRLRPDERAVLRKIMAQPSCSLAVRDVFPHFKRESEEHKTLRRLRAGQFIRPAETGHWVPEERIELKPFGQIVWNHCGEENLFEEVTGHGSPAAEPTVLVSAREIPADERVSSSELVLDLADDSLAMDDDLLDLVNGARSELAQSK
jgi:hypothetical protein